ncbi:MAG: hypothetical protein ACLQL2_11985 [Methylovirgula sp.]
MKILLILSSLLLAAIALAPGPAAAQSREQAAIANACASMGIDPAVETYIACERSLAKTAASMDEARRTAREQAVCRRRGYRPGTSAFALCVLDREAAAGPERTAAFGVPTMAPEPHTNLAVAFFDNYQRGDQTTSVNRACAMMGTVPGTQGFQTCTGNLNMTINDEDLDANGY